jgi:NADH-quinone oxidoreductase subunit M
LLGTFQVSRPAAIVASLGLVFATVYALWLVQRVFHGPDAAGADNRSDRGRRGLSLRETIMFAVAIIVLLWLGLYPQTLLRTVKPTSDFLLRAAPAVTASQSANPGPAPAVTVSRAGSRQAAPAAPAAASGASQSPTVVGLTRSGGER